MFCPTIYKQTPQIIFILYIGHRHCDSSFFTGQDNYNEALDFLEKALEMYQRLYEGDHEDIAATLYSIGKMNYYLKSVIVL